MATETPGVQINYGTHVNIFWNMQNPTLNPIGIQQKAKPAGYSKIMIDTWLSISSQIQPGNRIYFDLAVIVPRQYAFPYQRQFMIQPFFLDDSVTPITNGGKWLVVRVNFTGLNKDIVIPFLWYIQRRNDQPNPDNAELWVFRHVFAFRI